ncbi:MAG: hypothetical protein JXB38_04610, partial [Anaerolineales bacterium]|nr:hypothetical protein [Anaerolineales bacterium]
SFMVTLILLLLVSLENLEEIKNIRHWLGLGVLVGVSTWVRPEGLTLLGPVLLAALLLEKNWRRRAAAVGLALGGFAAFFGPYLFFNRALAGEWWPNTFFAKQAEYAVHQNIPLVKRLLQQYGQPLVGAGAILLPGFGYFIYRMIKEKRWVVLLGAVWVVGHLSLYALRLPVTYQHGRYVMAGMPVYFLMGFAGVSLLAKPRSREFWPRVLSMAWLLTLVLVLVGFSVLGAQAYGNDVAFIETEMVEAARWIAANTPPDALIGAHDIGALGYYAHRPILDLAGLVTPDVVPFIRDETRLAEYLDSQEAAYLVTFPGWYPQLVAGRTPVYETGGIFSQATGGENMAVYGWRAP